MTMMTTTTTTTTTTTMTMMMMIIMMVIIMMVMISFVRFGDVKNARGYHTGPTRSRRQTEAWSFPKFLWVFICARCLSDIRTMSLTERSKGIPKRFGLLTSAFESCFHVASTLYIPTVIKVRTFESQHCYNFLYYFQLHMILVLIFKSFIAF